jgi:hypothetical protein
MITVADPNRPWNRIRVRGIAIFVVVTIAAFSLWKACEGVVHDIAWDLHNHRAVSFRGQSVQLPWFWSGFAWNRHLYLVRHHFGPTSPTDVLVTLVNLTPADVQESMDLERLDVPKSPGFYGEDVSIDPNFRCFENGSVKPRSLVIRCNSIDGYWSVFLSDADKDREDFRTILHTVAIMRKTAE